MGEQGGGAGRAGRGCRTALAIDRQSSSSSLNQKGRPRVRNVNALYRVGCRHTSTRHRIRNERASGGGAHRCELPMVAPELVQACRPPPPQSAIGTDALILEQAAARP